MWTRKLLKDNAKIALSRTYWVSFATTVIFAIISGASGYVTTFITAITGIAGVVMSFIPILFSIFVIAVLQVGLNRYFMEARAGKAPMSTLFSTFNTFYMNIVKVQFFVSLFIFLWSLLLVVPGIIKSYEYRMVPYILSENPNISKDRAFFLSKQMTEGEKWNMFVLDLSFIGWNILGALACGIGIYFVMPYYLATVAELYTAQRTKVMMNGFTDANELPGFIAY